MSNTYIDRNRPAIAIVSAGEDGNPSYFPGYWQPNGRWSDIDAGVGGEGLAVRITSELRDSSRVELVIQSFEGGHLSDRTYTAADRPENGGVVELPTAPPDVPPLFALRIELDTPGMNQPEMVSAALRRVADEVDDLQGVRADGFQIPVGELVRDTQGAIVGSWSATLPETDEGIDPEGPRDV